MNKPILGVTLGDAAGIGSEIVARAAARGALSETACPVIVADDRLFRLGMRIAKADFDYQVTDDIAEAVETAKRGRLVVFDTKSVDMANLELGQSSLLNGKEEGELLVKCIRWCQEGRFDGFCFAPLNKGIMKKAGYDFPSEHEMFAHYYGVTEQYGEMNVLNGLWNIRVTSHIPLEQVCANLTRENIIDSLTLGLNTLKRAGIAKPRLAMAALNPHCGDGGTCGRQEIELLAPIVKEYRDQGVDIKGPFASDTLFIRAFKGEFDGVVTMYHDQGQIAIKLKGFEHTVTVSAGLPHAVTTPAHGTAYDIAGKGAAISSTFEDAYRVCASMAANRSV